MRRTATCTFEFLTKESLQMIVHEHEDGFSKVIEIAQVRLDTPRGGAVDILNVFLAKSGLPFDLSFKTFWPADITAAKHPNDAFNAILDAYPGHDGDLVSHDTTISTGV